MNWKNTAENLLIVIVSALIGGFIGFTSSKMTLKQVQPTLDKAIEKATNEINNKIDLDKIKKSNDIELILTPNNEQIAVRDTCIPFNIEKLTEGQRRRLKRWLED